MNDAPDMSNIPEDREGYLRGLYAEIRQLRRHMENFFWIFAVYAGFVLLALWLYATDEKREITASQTPAPAASQYP